MTTDSPADGMNRRAIRSTPHSRNGQAAHSDPASRSVEWLSRHPRIAIGLYLPGVVGVAVDLWRPSAVMAGLLVVLTPVSLLASVGLLAGWWSRRRP